NLWASRVLEDTIYKRISESDLNKNLKYLYSDLPYYLLKKIAENTYGIPYEQLTEQEFFASLGANFTGYNPAKRFSLEQIPPTEIDQIFRMETIQGYVHDQGAAMMGGVSGHAGLFANANDVNKIMQLFLQ